MEKGDRFYINGRAATIYGDPKPTGMISVVYDGAQFTSTEYVDVGTWEPCDQSEMELFTARVRAQAAALGIKV